LCSDGLQQYFTNEEAVATVDSFITSSPDRDPAQLLINEALFRAAKKAGKNVFFRFHSVYFCKKRKFNDTFLVTKLSKNKKFLP